MPDKVIGKALIIEKQKLLPPRPGVYRMISAEGKVLYVGKAKNLKNRVAAYTKPESLSFRIAHMVSLAADLVVIECSSEAEAFLLENELIKKFRPPYNILLKDDKSYPSLFLETETAFPKLLKHRGKQNRKGFYFGPFASVDNLNRTLSFLQKVFGLRTCSENDFHHRSRPCLLYQIKKCSGPCCHLISKEAYAENVEAVKNFLFGKSDDLQKILTQEMYRASENEEYEKALMLRERIKSLNELQAQRGENGTVIEADVIGLMRQSGYVCVQMFFFRKGMNNGSHAIYFQDDADKTTEEMLESFLGQFYTTHALPKEILLATPLPKDSVLEEAFSNKSERKVSVSVPVRGIRRHLSEQVLLNAREALKRYLIEKGIQKEDWQNFSHLLGKENVGLVEVYDNSHLQGTSSVGAMIVASCDGFEKNKYRKFNIDTSQVNPEDDFAMMEHVLTRRCTGPDPLPDVMIIDGGKGQVGRAYAVVERCRLTDKVAVVGVAKGENRNAGNEKLVFPDGREIFLGNQSPILHLIERLRDEAHRFAIGTHRAKRQKAFLSGEIEEIAGIGPKRKKALLEYFGSVKAIKDASLAELLQVSGISEKFAQNIYDFFHA